ncbi:hypothetical protein Aca07nite_71400 [Actinoplanes capillaceus]|uniref:Uncharacterized protein n=1 Tax=Actinoplanes campanulatus TaxID=113559 RepID=A0ABQ3WUD0_9ACTN|nr:hypothetical protein Aca07nite_71400 [Actinoplanes capillaceus]
MARAHAMRPPLIARPSRRPFIEGRKRFATAWSAELTPALRQAAVVAGARDVNSTEESDPLA